MIKENWRAWRFWRWWWHARVPGLAKIAALSVATGLLLTGGYFASSHLTGASAANGTNTFVLQTTVTKIVTLREHGKTVVKRIPVVIRRQVVHSKTSYETIVDTQVVTKPGGVRYVTRKVLKYVPVVKKKIVKVNGKTTTLTQTRVVPTVKTETQTLTNVVTQQQTVTNQSTVVVKSTSTNVVTQPVTTVVTHTVTLPPDTVTQTETHTQTETRTETVVSTVTLPPNTVTVTVTTTDSGPGGGGP